jgi:uncharacterized protein with HEPN domain
VSRDFRLYLDDMLDAARQVLVYTRTMTCDQFRTNRLVRDAVVLNLQIVGEAASHVPDEVRARHPEVEWRRMVGLRNVIAHGYFALHLETLWDIVENHLPVLLGQVERILAESPEP